MKRPAISRRLVVDTNVARAASTSEHPVADACRQALETMQTARHCVVLSATQYAEWQRHQSPYAKKWLTVMMGKKLFVVLSPEPNELGTRLAALECAEKVRAEMQKDLHLLENALATDHAVLSLETNVLALFCLHAVGLAVPRPVAWVSPAADAPACVAWLQAGAPVAGAAGVPAGQ